MNSSQQTEIISFSTNLILSNVIRNALPSARVNTTPLALTVRTTPLQLRNVTSFLAKATNIRSGSLVDIAVTDRLGVRGRFSVKYLFLSSFYNNRLIVEVYADETTAVPSIAGPFFNRKRIFASAGWLEREVWDLFGIYFTENGDLRRILTDYGFTGHPLRKDFPLTGFHELVYNDAEGRVTVEAVELAQEFRVFHL